jgi:hypothetical protein
MTTQLESMDAELSRVYGELTAAQLECDGLRAERDTARQMLADFTDAGNQAMRITQASAVATEAERDRLALEVAALRKSLDTAYVKGKIEGRREGDAERRELDDELARVRGSMPDDAMLDDFADVVDDERSLGYADKLRDAAASIRAAAKIQALSATPHPAKAGTDGENLRALEKLLVATDGEPVLVRTWLWSELTDRPGEVAYGVQLVDEPSAKEFEAPTLAAAIEAALAARLQWEDDWDLEDEEAEALAALATDQEVDHAAQ